MESVDPEAALDSTRPSFEDGAVQRTGAEISGARRVAGLPVLAGIVVLGLLSGAAYYQWQRPRVLAQMERAKSEAPTTPRERLELWHRYGAAQIHHRLTQFARFSPEMPWLVTHAIAGTGAEPPEIWGIDCEALPQELSHLEDMTVIVELPAPRPLGRAPLSGDFASRVPLYAPGQPIPDPAERLRDLALFLLEGMPRALARDIEGATIEIRVGTAGGSSDR